jgi:hypothetical protein
LLRREASRANAQLAGKVMSAVLIIGLMSALMGGGSGSSGGQYAGPSEEERQWRIQRENNFACQGGDANACHSAGMSVPNN